MQPINSIEFNELEHQVNHLLRLLEELKLENKRLLQKVESQTRERSLLAEKNREAAHKLKKLISQLREGMS